MGNQRTDEMGCPYHGYGMPEPDPKLVGMSEECDRLSDEKDELKNEKRYFEEEIKEVFKAMHRLSFETKEKVTNMILSEYDDKIENCSELHRAISERLCELGYSA